MKKILLLGLFLVIPAFASQTSDNIRYQWDNTMFGENLDKVSSLEKIRVKFEGAKDVDSLVWRAIVVSSIAGEKGGLSALGLMNDALSLVQQANKKNRTIAGIVTEGGFYFLVPSWPIGFGDDEKSLVLLLEAISASPDDIDANYFLGRYYEDDGSKDRARVYYNKVLTLSNNTRILFTSARHKEVTKRLSNFNSKGYF